MLVTAAMTFSWLYFQRVATYYHALMLIFLAGMAGFGLVTVAFLLIISGLPTPRTLILPR